MPQAIIYLDEKLDEKISSLSKSNRISKHDLILRILKQYKGELNGEGSPDASNSK